MIISEFPKVMIRQRINEIDDVKYDNSGAGHVPGKQRSLLLVMVCIYNVVIYALFSTYPLDYAPYLLYTFSFTLLIFILGRCLIVTREHIKLSYIL